MREGGSEADIYAADVAVQTEIVQMYCLCPFAILMLVIGGVGMTQGLLAGPDFEVGPKGMVVLDLFLLFLRR